MFIRTTPAAQDLGAGPARPATLYGMRSFSSLGIGMNDGNLGKSLLKKVAAAVSKPVQQVAKAAETVAKVAVAPIAVAAASSLQSVGLRNAAGKVIDATAVNKNIAKKEKNFAKSAGTAIDVGAVVVAGTVAAPYVASAASAAGHGALLAATKAGTLLKTGAGLLGGLIKKPAAVVGAAAATDVSAIESVAAAVKKGGKKLLGGIQKTLSPYPTADTTNAAPVVDAAGASGASASLKNRAKKALSFFQNPAAGQQAAYEAAAAAAQAAQPSAGAPAANPLTEAGVAGLGMFTDPKFLMIGGAMILGTYLMNRKGSTRVSVSSRGPSSRGRR